ncbi:sister chromatid cohesion protein 1 [Mycoemilia scoparia]|uniref:Sister chromatid cohesion protein 1 n=1 Tax=Mycoemilia scoparia TaxID=417184 RepID=A0A9W8A8K8_9FUNG|nr:sister chromatid cohesion protein 1 [Mycoemilia scoparia]
MFYAEAILSKKGSLAKVWLAAHWERKITKTQFLQANVPNSVNAIIGGDHPPLALRLSGQLLLGIARIYSRKARYLLEDCNEALLKIKMTFRPGVIDMSSENMVANTGAITMSEALTEYDILLPMPGGLLDWEDVHGASGPVADTSLLEGTAARNTSRLQDITLADASFDASAIARGDKGELDFDIGGEDLLGRDNDFELNLDEPMLLSPGPNLNLEGDQGDDSHMDVEVPRDAPQPFQESIVGIEHEDLPAMSKGDQSLVLPDVSLAESGAGLGFEGELRFQDEFEIGRIGEDQSMLPLPSAEESALLEAEADILLPQAQPSSAPTRKRKAPITDNSTMYSNEYISQHLRNTADIVHAPDYILPSSKLPRININDPAGLAHRLLKPSEGYHIKLPQHMASLFTRELPLIRGFADDELDDSRMLEEADVACRAQSNVPDEDDWNLGEDGDQLQFLDEHGDDAEVPGGVDKVDLPDISAAELEKAEKDAIERSRLSVGPGISLFGDDQEDLPEQQSGIQKELGLEQGGDEEHPDGDDSSVLTGFSRNTVGAIHLLDGKAKKSSETNPKLSFNDITDGARRRDAVKLFFELLVLKTKDFVDVEQSDAFGDITISPHQKLHETAESLPPSHVTTSANVI